ncbi:uncharacterized protein CIMG_13183 [Coccidioides immitis RS]|uniref:Uncharacterized protein n=1 Tax=Coccidioides immitis (strain RS) TaxID=246410 RepID=J3K5X7_COCIM|nr:uncharacterized protein CIMG_13183 [Coccidioides immitis RS]EAS29897.3 hypothetical protein CIMG_13183 [Coccidioides immitis RS]
MALRALLFPPLCRVRRRPAVSVLSQLGHLTMLRDPQGADPTIHRTNHQGSETGTTPNKASLARHLTSRWLPRSWRPIPTHPGQHPIQPHGNPIIAQRSRELLLFLGG